MDFRLIQYACFLLQYTLGQNKQVMGNYTRKDNGSGNGKYLFKTSGGYVRIATVLSLIGGGTFQVLVQKEYIFKE